MSFVPYQLAANNSNTWGWITEGVHFRDRNNNGTKDETNAAGDTFLPLPIRLAEDGYVVIRECKKWNILQGTSRMDPEHIAMEGYEDLLLEFSGELLDMSWLYQLADKCANSGGSAPYTHQVDGADALDNPPPSMELWRCIKNDKTGGGESVYLLYVGCRLVNLEFESEAGKTVLAKVTIHVARVVAGTALTTPPMIPKVNPYLGIWTLTLTKGTIAYQQNVTKFKFAFLTDKRYIKGGGDYYGVAPLLANKREIYIIFTIFPYETDSFDDSQDAPTTAQDKDLVFKLYKNLTDDFFQFSLANAMQQLLKQGFNKDKVYEEEHKWFFNPMEASPTWDITVNDSYTAARYS